MGKLSGRVALITGGASGMGAAHARALAAEGAAVAVCDINAAQGEVLAREVGGRFFKLDVTREEEWADVVSEVASRLGAVTILVNNAGVSALDPVQNVTTEQWNRIMAVNVNGPFFGIRAIAPQMKAAGGGVIVNVSSTGGMAGLAGAAAYTTSKWAVRGLTKAAALDLAGENIRVLSLHPALVRTPMSSKLDLARATADYPIPRPGEPEELAKMLLFMVADATYSTGSEFIADGGAMI